MRKVGEAELSRGEGPGTEPSVVCNMPAQKPLTLRALRGREYGIAVASLNPDAER
jgi:hypothetical protein